MENSSKRRFIGAFSFFLLIGLVVILYSCNDDHGLTPNFFKGTVKGELQFRTAVPDTTDEIRVALAESFPPSSLQGLVTSSNLASRVSKDPSVTSQIVPFEMNAPYGTYGGVFVIWKAKNQSFQLTDIIGVHGNLDNLELKSVEVTEEKPVADSVNIPVDLSRVDRTSRIEGKLTFVGEWPSNTLIVALAVVHNPQDLLSGIPPGILFVPKNVTEFDYSLGIAPTTPATGPYGFIFVAWLPVGEKLDLSKLVGIGFYPDPDNPNQPGSVIVPDSTIVRGIDIVSDFSLIPSNATN